LLRRFIHVRLDAHMEEPERRYFKTDIIADTHTCRSALLEYVLTIWRWGRQNEANIKRGIPFGNFEQWARWCRDPLLALGAQDPVARISEMRAMDPERDRVLCFLEAWHSVHGDKEMHLSYIERSVRLACNPGEDMTQKVFENYIAKNVDTQIGPYVLLRGKPVKKKDSRGIGRGRPVATYRVEKREEDEV
jgi:hypothetical protein